MNVRLKVGLDLAPHRLTWKSVLVHRTSDHDGINIRRHVVLHFPELLR